MEVRMLNKQVDKQHYDFLRYVSKPRWNSVWHQIDEVLKLKPNRVLEIGPGPGIFKNIMQLCGVTVKTLDLDPELNPDYLGSATAIPFADRSFDVVCAFQMLEHLSYENSLLAFEEILRVSSKHVVISLPDSRPVWRILVHVPKLGRIAWLLPRPFSFPRRHSFDGEHYWEINKRDYALSKVISELSRKAVLRHSYRVFENPKHRFFVFEKDL
jgi:predicted SAM-dependent methyltransferase